jgi:la-related protein 1
MDARGWIAIPLIASFNRIRQLTMDINIVREVLCISSIVQVLDNWVRMGGWEQWVLPDASPSSVDEGEVGIPYAGGIPPTHYGELVPSSSHPSLRPTIVVDEHGHMHKVYADNGQGEEEEEDDVEFVMGKDS